MKYFVELLYDSTPHNFLFHVEDIEDVIKALDLIEIGINIADGEYLGVEKISKKASRGVKYVEMK